MGETGSEQEAVRLKSLAEAEFKSSNPKSALKHAKAADRLFPSLPGLSQMVTCFKILAAASDSASSSVPDYYAILQVERFSHINIIRKQYKSLALSVHPDKNASLGSEEAFKLIGDAFSVLNDRIRRKEYDTKLRMMMQEEVAGGGGSSLMDDVVMERFWTACSWCKILHQFEKKYLGHNLVCPSCGKSFRAVVIGDNNEDTDGDLDGEKALPERLAVNAKRKLKAPYVDGLVPKRKVKRKETAVMVGDETATMVEEEEEEEMTLAEMQLEAKRKSKEDAAERIAHGAETGRSSDNSEIMRCSGSTKAEHLQVYRRGTWRRRNSTSKEIEKAGKSKDRSVEMVLVEDSDFYDFGKDRSERRFKKGQVWSVYDRADGMPRGYCLIDEVSVSPFVLRVSTLDLQRKDTSGLPCGKFKVAQKAVLRSVKLLSHVVDCERAARELYRIFPSKGSIWAIRRSMNKCSHDIVVFLTSYSEAYGLSMAYLVRVDGFKTVFKRKEIGAHAVHLLDKGELGICSHQIPARRLKGREVPGLLKECWELDPAALPPDLLTTPAERDLHLTC
ncbi:hypothetical protein SAY86_027412 [Trapa natans]|uniref:J domain-containing protein n=1 Tax=Trapa natans TaxID=22666 RepID=A0AAN7QIU5_TRANT|nr:hypothetical protein SAY86_027412 [Trapa natans]